eukprot:28442-Pyramimonas_sp.AAC.3
MVAWVIGGDVKSFLMHLRRHSCHALLQNPQSAERVLGVAVVAQCFVVGEGQSTVPVWVAQGSSGEVASCTLGSAFGETGKR